MFNLTQFMEEKDDTVRSELARIANIRKQYAVHHRANLDFEANYRISRKIIHKYRRYLNEHVLWLNNNIPLPNTFIRDIKKRLGGVVALLREMFEMFNGLCNFSDQLSPNFNVRIETVKMLNYLKNAVQAIMDTLNNVAKLRRIRHIKLFVKSHRLQYGTVLEKLDRALANHNSNNSII